MSDTNSDETHGVEGTTELENTLIAVELKLDEAFEAAGRQALTDDEAGAGMVLEQVLDLIYDSFGSVIPYDRIGVATNFGPRVVSLSWRDGAELFAQLEPSVTVEHPDRPYVLHGGHRLWVAPEVPAVTYAPDDAPCEVREDGETILIDEVVPLAKRAHPGEETVRGMKVQQMQCLGDFAADAHGVDLGR